MFNANSKMKYLVLMILPGIIFSIDITSSVAGEWVPVYEEPRHRLVFENDQAFILDVNLSPGYVSLYHEHKLDLLYVTISGTKVWAEPLGGNKREADVKSGDLRFSSDNHSLPHVHRVGNIGKTPFHVIGIGIKGENPAGVIAIEGDLDGLVMDMEKQHASVYRIRLEPGEKTGLHQHNLPYTQVYLSHGTLTDQSGKPMQVEVGEFLWNPGGKKHLYENTGKQAVNIIEMQWR